jgi:hypothetical protein
MYLVISTSHPLQHFLCIGSIPRLPEYPAPTFGDGIAAQNQAAIKRKGNILGFLKGQPGDEFRSRLATARAALRRVPRRANDKIVSGRRKQLATAR